MAVACESSAAGIAVLGIRHHFIGLGHAARRVTGVYVITCGWKAALVPSMGTASTSGHKRPAHTVFCGCLRLGGFNMVVPPEKELAWNTIGLLLYPGFEPLDVYGPLQIFGALTKSPWKRARRLITIAEEEGPVESSMGVATVASHSVDTAPPCDVIVVPGGIGSRVSMHNPVLINFLRQRYADERLQHLMTVCTGEVRGAAGLEVSVWDRSRLVQEADDPAVRIGLLWGATQF